MKRETKAAVTLCPLATITYAVCYYFRSILNVLTPVLDEKNVYGLASLALFSSVFMVVYALGQLFNGYAGDSVKPKYMTLCGNALTGIGLIMFVLVPNKLVGIICYALIGFGQSMLRGPLIKAISENSTPAVARLGCVLITFVSYLGPTLVGIVSSVLSWYPLYLYSGILSLIIGIICFVVLDTLERKGIIKTIVNTNKTKLDLLTVFKLDRFPRFFFIGLIIGITDISVGYWMTTYFRERLLLPQEQAAGIYSALYLICAIAPFATLAIYKLFKNNDIMILRIGFALSALFMVLTTFIDSAVLGIAAFSVAMICAAICSATLWSIYVPSLAKSGRVSSVNGVLDCSTYFSASFVNLFVVPISDAFGWSGVTLFWAILISCGFIVTFVKNKSGEASK